MSGRGLAALLSDAWRYDLSRDMSSSYQRDPFLGQIDPKDEKDLDTLALLTRIYGGLCALGAVLMVVFLGVLAFVVPVAASSPSRSGGVQGVGVFGFYLVVMLVGAGVSCAMTWLYFKAASCIDRRESKTLIYVAAALACTNAPQGLALGIYTFVLLERPSIKALFTG